MEKPQKRNIPLLILLAKYFRDIRQSFLYIFRLSRQVIERFRDPELLRFFSVILGGT